MSDDNAEDTSPAPAPRPRSAASRARRIGGAAAAPRPGTDAAATTAKPVNIDKVPAPSENADIASKPAKAGEPAKRANAEKPENAEKPVKPEKAATTSTASATSAKTTPADDESGSRSRTLTVSVPGWARWAPSVVFAAVAVVFLTLFAVARIGGDEPPTTTSSTMRQEVLAAAKTCLAALNTYRYTALDAAETAGAKCTTGKLTSDYKKTVSTVIRKNAPPLKAVQLCKINTAGIESVTRDGKQWTVLAYGQLNITTANLKQGRIDPFAVVARLEQVKGKWVLSKIDTVSSVS